MGHHRPEMLRKAYSVANKRRIDDPAFKLRLYGGAALIASNGIDPIDAAIQLHALKPKLGVFS